MGDVRPVQRSFFRFLRNVGTRSLTSTYVHGQVCIRNSFTYGLHSGKSVV